MNNSNYEYYQWSVSLGLKSAKTAQSLEAKGRWQGRNPALPRGSDGNVIGGGVGKAPSLRQIHSFHFTSAASLTQSCLFI